MKILYILRHIPVPSETFVISEIIALQHQGIEIYPVSLLPAQKCQQELMSQIKNAVVDLSDQDVKSTAVESPFYEKAASLGSEFGMSLSLVAQAALIADLVKNHHISHIHAHFATESAFVAMLASKLSDIPFTFTSHAYDIFRSSPTGTIKEDSPERRLRILLREAALAFTVSEFNKRHIVAMTDQAFAENINIIRCGIDTDKFEPLTRNSRNELGVLCVGRFVEKKGYEYLLRSFRKLTEIFDNARLRIIGDGDLKDAMQLFACELGIASKIEFLGAVSSEVVLSEMNRADIFALHSVTASDGDMEGIPVSIMESMATGLPVVSTNHSGIPELVIDGATGFLARERDVDEFSNYLIALASSRELRERMGRTGRKHVADNFNLSSEAMKLADYFSEISKHRLINTIRRAYTDSVDIIMPTYNCDISLMRRAIQSIINQEYKEWQLYIVRDGGDVDVAPLVKEFNDSRIHYDEIPHAGKPAALNHAISKGSSKYIAYLDDDDIWYPSHLQSAILHMTQNDVKFVHSDAFEVTMLKEGISLKEISRKILNLGILTDKTLVSISHINALHERSLIDEAGLYDESRRYFIDWDMFIRMALISRPSHLRKVTCEHYIYVDKNNKQTNTITGIHKNDPELSKKMQAEMYKRCFHLLTPDDFIEFVGDWSTKAWQVPAKDVEIAALKKSLEGKDEKIQELHDSLSWRITSPLRHVYDLIFRKK